MIISLFLYKKIQMDKIFGGDVKFELEMVFQRSCGSCVEFLMFFYFQESSIRIIMMV